MGFDQIPELRLLLQGIPTGVLTPTQRYTLMIINSYCDDDDPRGSCWIGHENLSKQLGVSIRGLNVALHKLGGGYDCKKHPREFHLDLIQRHVRNVRVGTRQNYSIKWDNLRSLSSMYSGSPSKSESMNSHDLEHELASTRARTEVHPYKHNKHNKHLQNDYYIKQIIEVIPNEKKKKLGSLENLDALITQYRVKGGIGQHLVDVLNMTQWDQIHSPAKYLVGKVKSEIESFVPTPTPGRFRAEDFQ
jgi:hypothetical protein